MRQDQRGDRCWTRYGENVRQAFVLEGFETALVRRNRHIADAEVASMAAAEAKLIDSTDFQPPPRLGHGTCRVLADQLVGAGIERESISFCLGRAIEPTSASAMSPVSCEPARSQAFEDECLPHVLNRTLRQRSLADLA